MGVEVSRIIVFDKTKKQAQTPENTQQAKTNPQATKTQSPGDNIVKYAVGYYGC